MDINSEIKLVVNKYNLGKDIKNISKVTGGLSHKMYKVETDIGTYAIKLLNPGIMKRKTAYSNFVFSEEVACLAKKNGIPAICAIKLDDAIISKINNNYYMVFEWIKGTVLKSEEITLKHCEIIGKTIAKIHNIDFSIIENNSKNNIDENEFDWNKFVPLAEKQNKPYFNELKQNIELLYTLNKKSIEALKYAKNNMIISHRDLDRKNVIWQKDTPFIIDWEASGYINPTIELIQVAWYWSGGDVEALDYEKFKIIIDSYKENYKGTIDKNIDTLMYADYYGGLNWLEYNLKRSLCIENIYDEDEIKLAEKEVIQSLKEIKYNLSQFDKITSFFK